MERQLKFFSHKSKLLNLWKNKKELKRGFFFVQIFVAVETDFPRNVENKLKSLSHYLYLFENTT